MQLNEKEWLPFKIESLFNIGKGIYLNKKDIHQGMSPYITASASNNGITRFIGNDTLFDEDTITIEKVKLTAFYQPTKYYCSHDVSVVSSEKLNKFNAIFTASMINRQGDKYSYGRQAQLNVVKRETVFLPVHKVDNVQPDWQFMEDYTQQLIQAKKQLYIAYCKQELAKLTYKEVLPLEQKEWGEFFIENIFTIQRGKRLTKESQITGQKPYVSSTAMNNGVDDFIGNDDGVRIFDNCLTIANSGSVGSSFYHPYNFVASDHVTHLKNISISKFAYFFIASMLNRLSEKYNFNREINDKRIKREKILLPMTQDKQPDYAYMEQYMINLEYQKRSHYLNYIQQK